MNLLNALERKIDPSLISFSASTIVITSVGDGLIEKWQQQ